MRFMKNSLKIKCLIFILIICTAFSSLSISEGSDLEQNYNDFIDVTGYTSDHVGTGFIYSDSMLLVNQNEYSTDLVKVSMSLAAAGYDQTCVTNMLLQMGFGCRPYLFTERSLADNDHVAFTVGKKYLSEENATLWIVVVRGTLRNQEWYSNFNLGTGIEHQGFRLAANEVEEIFSNILYTEGRGNNIILFTGHSRGAAVANILAADYTENPNLKVFGYTFACPAVSKYADKNKSNIYNINNKGDMITLLPMKDWGYDRNGITKEFSFASEPVFTEKYLIDNKTKYEGLSGSLTYEAILTLMFPSLEAYFSPAGHLAIMMFAWGLAGFKGNLEDVINLSAKQSDSYFYEKLQELLEERDHDISGQEFLDLVADQLCKPFEEYNIKLFLSEALISTEYYDENQFQQFLSVNEEMISKTEELTNVKINKYSDLELAFGKASGLYDEAKLAKKLVSMAMDMIDAVPAIDPGHNHASYVQFVNNMYFGYYGRSGTPLTSITIPNDIKTIGRGCFSNCNSLATVTLPDTIQCLGESCFSGCSSLKTVSSSNSSLIHIGDSAFNSCSTLSAFDLSEAPVKYIGKRAFMSCSSLNSIIIPNSVEVLGEYSLARLTNLTELTIPVEYVLSPDVFRFDTEHSPTVNKIEYLHITEGKTGIMSDSSSDYKDYNFLGRTVIYSSLSTLKTVDMDEGIKNIGNYAFCDYDLVTTDMESFVIHIPSSVTKIGDYAFQYHKGFDTIDLPEGLVDLGEGCFQRTSLKYINIPSTVVSIPDLCFCGSALETLTIPETVEECGDACFGALSNLTDLTVPLDFLLSTKIYVYPHGSFYFINSHVSKLHVTKGTTGIMPDVQITSGSSDYYFRDTIIYTSGSSLEEIYLDEGIQNIGDYVFYKMGEITITGSHASQTVITFPSTLKKIGKYAFSEQSRIADIVLPEGLSELGKGCFFNTKLKSISFPSSLTMIPSSCLGTPEMRTLTIPNTIEEIEQGAFRLNNLKTLTIPAKYVTASNIISFHSFSGAYEITPNIDTVIITEGADGIIPDLASNTGDNVNDYKSTFISANREKIKKIVIEDGVKHIGSYSFCDVEGPCEIYIPNTIESIGESAFSQAGISAVYYDGRKSEWNLVSIEENNDNLINAPIKYLRHGDLALTASIDALTYDYADQVIVTADITIPDDPTEKLDDYYPDPIISAMIITADGEEIEELNCQTTGNYSMSCGIPLVSEGLEAGYYKIKVWTNVEDLATETEVFQYTADKSKVTDPSGCQIQLTLDPAYLAYGETITMTANVTDSNGLPARGVKVLFYALDQNRESIESLTGDSGICAITVSTGVCSQRCTIPEDYSIPEGEYIICASVMEGLTSDEKTFTIMDKNGLPINSVYFPDESFRAVVETFDTNGDMKLSQPEIKAVTEIHCPYKNISNMTGIQYFTALESLDCYDNQLTSLDLSANPLLTYLSCDSNKLTTLDLSANPLLQYLYCDSNKLTTLDLSANPLLTNLSCSKNSLSSLNLVNNSMLEVLSCSSNLLSKLNINNNNTSLQYLYCEFNRITSLDFSNNRSLIKLDCSNNILTSLELGSCISLQELDCYYNRLTELDISGDPSLNILNCYSNQLMELDVSGNPSLNILNCHSNQITNLNISGNPNLIELRCYSNQLMELDISGNANLRELECYSNQLSELNVLTSFNIDKLVRKVEPYPELDSYIVYSGSVLSSEGLGSIYCCLKIDESVDIIDNNDIFTCIDINAENFQDENFRAVVETFDTNGDMKLDYTEIEDTTDIYCNSKNIESMTGIQFFTSLESLYVGNNRLTSLDLSGNGKLRSLNCSGNQLTSLDLSSNPLLDSLFVDDNQLISLNLSGNVKLGTLYCKRNQLTSLNLSNNTELCMLYCDENQLVSLDLSSNPLLQYLEVSNNQLVSLDLSGNSELSKLDCDRNQLVSLDLSQKAFLSTINCSNNQLTYLNVDNDYALEYLNCSWNQLTELNVNNNDTLATLECSYNQLRYLNVDNDCALKSLYCRSNQLTKLNINSNSALTTLFCSNNQLKSLNLKNQSVLEELDCINNHLTILDISRNLALSSLSCCYNELIEVDISNNPYLLKLVNTTDPMDMIDHLQYYYSEYSSEQDRYITYNLMVDYSVQIVTDNEMAGNCIDINPTNFPDEHFREFIMCFDQNNDMKLQPVEIDSVEVFDICSKEINSLEGIQYFSSLKKLDCSENQLTELDITKNTELIELICCSNQLTSLDISKNPDLTVLRCHSNQLTELSLLKNLYLKELVETQDPVLKGNSYLEYSMTCWSDELSEYTNCALEVDIFVNVFTINKCMITFDANDGEGNMEPLAVFIGADCILPQNDFVRPGFHFIGWISDYGETYEDQELIEAVQRDMLLSAQWSVDIQSISLDTYDKASDRNISGGQIHYSIIQKEENDLLLSDNTVSGAINLTSQGINELKLEAIPDEGYEFIGWFTGTVRSGTDQTLLPTDELISLSLKCSIDITGNATWYPICAVFTDSRILKLPSSLSRIDAEAFTGISATIVEVPSGCSFIGDEAFKDSSVSMIYIPKGCEIGTNVFDGCGIVVLISEEGSYAQAYCTEHDNCVFKERLMN